MKGRKHRSDDISGVFLFLDEIPPILRLFDVSVRTSQSLR